MQGQEADARQLGWVSREARDTAGEAPALAGTVERVPPVRSEL